FLRLLIICSLILLYPTAFPLEPTKGEIPLAEVLRFNTKVDCLILNVIIMVSCGPLMVILRFGQNWYKSYMSKIPW
ncbi:Os10g0158000, partial [Oryza sativa Japonica Group]